MENTNNSFMKYYADYKSADTWGKIPSYLTTKWHANRRTMGEKTMKVLQEIKSIINFISGFHKDMKIEFTPLSSMHWFNAIASNNQEFMETIYVGEEKILTPFGHFRFRFSKRFFHSKHKLYFALKEYVGKSFKHERVEHLGWSYIKYPISNPVFLFPSNTFIRKNLL